MRGTHYSSSTSRKSSSSEARFLFLVPVSNSYEHFVVLSTSSRGRFPCFCIVNLPSIFCRILKPLSQNLVVIPLRFFCSSTLNRVQYSRFDLVEYWYVLLSPSKSHQAAVKSPSISPSKSPSKSPSMRAPVEWEQFHYHSGRPPHKSGVVAVV